MKHQLNSDSRVFDQYRQIVDALAPADDETLPRKVCYDAFYGTPLDHLLRVWGVDTLMICGTLANICAHYTAASAALATS